jgi:hypothetical protein
VEGGGGEVERNEMAPLYTAVARYLNGREAERGVAGANSWPLDVL